MGQRARFERYAADMLYLIATGQRADPELLERFGAQVDEVYRNPFKRQRRQPQTAAEIREYIIMRLEGGKAWI